MLPPTADNHAMLPAEQIVQRQLDAYNARDLEAWLETYSPWARLCVLHGAIVAAGHDELRERMSLRFHEPDLHAQLLQRTVMGNIVVDHERITRNFPEGRGQLEMICVYEVADGLIQSMTFASSEPTLDP